MFDTYLINLGDQDLDVILGMDRMGRHGVILDSQLRSVKVNSPSHGISTFYLSSKDNPTASTYALDWVILEGI